MYFFAKWLIIYCTAYLVCNCDRTYCRNRNVQLNDQKETDSILNCQGINADDTADQKGCKKKTTQP